MLQSWEAIVDPQERRGGMVVLQPLARRGAERESGEGRRSEPRKETGKLGDTDCQHR